MDTIKNARGRQPKLQNPAISARRVNWILHRVLFYWTTVLDLKLQFCGLVVQVVYVVRVVNEQVMYALT